MDVVEQIKKRVRRAADSIVTELAVSHGIDDVTVAIKETGKSITVTIREMNTAEDETPDDLSETD